MRLFSLLLFVTLSTHAAVLEATYDISYWFLDHIATTSLRFESANGRYRIEANATLHGFAAALAHHHAEHHVSTGRIDTHGRLIPDTYRTERSLDGYKRTQRYTFDRQRHTIVLKQDETRMIETRHFDPLAMRYSVTESPQEISFTRRERYDADDDLLTLYFNARKGLKKLPPGQTVKLPCVGSRSGIVTVGKTARPLEFILFIDQDIFRSKEGKLDIEMDRNFFVKKAVLKDVFLFGDLKVQRQRLEERP